MSDMMKKVAWHLRPATDADYSKVSELRKSFAVADGSDRRSREAAYYDWKINTNPISRGHLNVADHDGQVVGITSLTPKSFKWKGRDVNAAEIGDTYTHREYQRQGMFSKLVNYTREQGHRDQIEFIYGTPNDQSLPGYRKLEFAELAGAKVFSYVCPLNVSGVLTERTRSPLLGALIGPFLSAGLRLWSFFVRPSSPIRAHKAPSFSPDVEELALRLQSKWDLVLFRSRRYLEWRFVTNPDEYTIFESRENDVVAGYMVTKVGRYGQLQVGYIADFLADPGRPEVFTALLKTALGDLRSKRVDMVACWAVRGTPFQRILRRFGFLEFKPVPVIADLHNVGTELREAVLSLHFTMADSDNI